jgi:hypothetical protein
MNIVTRLIQVIHWMSFMAANFFILLIIYGHFSGLQSFNLGEFIRVLLFVEGDNEAIYFAMLFYSAFLIIPFIRYIIFGRIGWFPWSPFRKE